MSCCLFENWDKCFGRTPYRWVTIKNKNKKTVQLGMRDNYKIPKGKPHKNPRGILHWDCLKDIFEFSFLLKEIQTESHN